MPSSLFQRRGSSFFDSDNRRKEAEEAAAAAEKELAELQKSISANIANKNRPILSLFDLIPGLEQFQDLRKGRQDQENPFNVLNSLFTNFNSASQQRDRSVPGAVPTVPTAVSAGFSGSNGK